MKDLVLYAVIFLPGNQTKYCTKHYLPVECGETSAPSRIVKVVTQSVESPVSASCAVQRSQKVGAVLEQVGLVRVQQRKLMFNFVWRQVESV